MDRRADLWAFGCMLYEMLTGQRAFPGEGVSDTLAHVLLQEPDWNALPADTVSLFAASLALSGAPKHQYAVAPDGQRFLMVVSADATIAPPITIVQNWLAGLLVPLGIYTIGMVHRGSGRGRRTAPADTVTEGRGKVFWTGRSQAIRVPRAFRLSTAEVRIRREGSRLVLEPVQLERDAQGWPQAFWALAGAAPDFEIGDRKKRHERGDVLAQRRRG